MDLPPHLHATRDLLMRSLPAHSLEQAPPMPAGLADELMQRFQPRARAAAITATAPVSFFGKLRAFLATPGFGMAATAVVVLGLGIPLLSHNQREVIRGGDSAPIAPGKSTAICFVGQDKTLQSAIEKSGLFEGSAFRSATSETALALGGRKVVVDFNANTITAYNAAGTSVHSVKIPDQPARVAGAVADAVSLID